ncbi:hypothetical protein ACQPXS_47070 (plasmid) [Streptomyces sp. CA-142005]
MTATTPIGELMWYSIELPGPHGDITVARTCRIITVSAERSNGTGAVS